MMKQRALQIEQPAASIPLRERLLQRRVLLGVELAMKRHIHPDAEKLIAVGAHLAERAHLCMCCIGYNRLPYVSLSVYTSMSHHMTTCALKYTTTV